MQTLFPNKPSSATVVLLAASVLLAIVGIGGIASGAADDDEPKQTAQVDSDTDDTTTTSLLDTGVTTTSLGGTVTTVKPTGTTIKRPTTTTAAPGPNECSSTPASSNPGGEQPPAIGTFTYVSCTDPNDSTDVKIAAGQNSGGVTRREITTSQGELGTVTSTTAYGPAGIVQEKLTIQANGVTLQCDWNPDITEYPFELSVGKTWTADSTCTAQVFGGSITIHATATRKITDRVITKIAATSVTAWVVDSTVNLKFTGSGGGQPINGAIDETSHAFFDPSRGLEVYDKSTSKGSGDFEYPETTTERHLKSLSPS